MHSEEQAMSARPDDWPKHCTSLYSAQRSGVACAGGVRSTVVAFLVGSFGVPTGAVEPASIDVGQLRITPQLRAGFTHTDNLFRAGSELVRNPEGGFLDVATVDSFGSVLSPEVKASIARGGSSYSAKYYLRDVRWFDSDDDNFTEHGFGVNGVHVFNARNRSEFSAGLLNGFEPRGSGLTEGAQLLEGVDAPLEFLRHDARLVHSYGSEATRGQMDFDIGYSDLKYQNFRDVTFFRDRENIDLGATFYWRIAPRTDALIEVQRSGVTYPSVQPGAERGALDSSEWRYRTGLRWRATGKTTGSIRVGYFQRDFDSEQRVDDNGFDWNVALEWSPRTYSTFTLKGGRQSRETNGLGDFINVEMLSVGWQHRWSQHSSTAVNLSVSDAEYSASDRDDEVLLGSLRYTRSIARWFDVVASLNYEDRDSTLGRFRYDRMDAQVGIEISL